MSTIIKYSGIFPETIGRLFSLTQIDTPVVSPVGGSYIAVQTVHLSVQTLDATIVYTLDGSTPSRTNGVVYTDALTLSSSYTLKAFAYGPDIPDSAVVTEVYSIVLTTGTPVISPAGGTFTLPTTVSISSTTGGATIYYTTDGSTPSRTNGSVYSSPFSLSATTTVKAFGVFGSYVDSGVSTSVFNVTLTVPTPTISPAGGSFTSPQTITLSTSGLSGTTIVYTTDGSTPSRTNGTTYGAPFTTSTSETVKAFAYFSSYVDSGVVSAAFTITLTVATPVVSPTGGTFSSAQTVTLTTTTSGATIIYTTDGSTPSSSNGVTYTAPLFLYSSVVLKAYATLSSYVDSGVASANFTFVLVVATPTISPNGGTYSSAQTITLATTTGGATIYYTTDGSTPSASNGTAYSTPFSLSTSETVKAIGLLSGYTDSAVASANFFIATFPNLGSTVELVLDTYSSAAVSTPNRAGLFGGSAPIADSTVVGSPTFAAASALLGQTDYFQTALKQETEQTWMVVGQVDASVLHIFIGNYTGGAGDNGVSMYSGGGQIFINRNKSDGSFDYNGAPVSAADGTTWTTLFLTISTTGASVDAYYAPTSTSTPFASLSGVPELPTRTLRFGSSASTGFPGPTTFAFFASWSSVLSSSDMTSAYGQVKTYLAGRGITVA